MDSDRGEATGPGAFGAHLRGLRLSARLSQKELADRSGVSARTISDLERGVWRTPRADSAAMLAEALGLDAASRAAWERIIRSERPSRRRGAVTITPLPSDRHAIVGRERHVAGVTKALGAGGRVVTVTGAGGIGKTRLAREIAQRWVQDEERSGVVAWVDLAGLSEPGDVLPEIARAVGQMHVDEAEAANQIVAALAGGPGLLVLDNFEHLLPAAPAVAGIAAASPRLAVLVTSRQQLGIAGEEVWRLPPLAAPPPGASEAALAASPPVACFLGRATLDADGRASPRLLRDAARIVRLLDGLPLAIELAAAQTALLPAGAIADLLEQGGLEVIEDHRPQAAGRQRTMSRTIAWSVKLLDAEARRGFRLLSVFRGGMSLSLASDFLALCGARHPQQTLLALVRASLLSVREDGDEPRYVMLEPIRLAGRAALEEAGETGETLSRHAALMQSVAAEARAAVLGNSPRAGFDLARRERMNLCAALDYAIVSGDDAAACGIAGALGWVWEMIDEEAQAARWFQRVVAMEPRAATAAERFVCAAWHAHYSLLWRHPDREAVPRLHAMAAASGDRDEMVRTLTYEAATILFLEGLQERADVALRRAMTLAGEDEPSFARSAAAQVAGCVALAREQFAEAERLLASVSAQRRALGLTGFLCYPLALTGYARYRQDRWEEAAAALIEALRIGLEVRHTVTRQLCGIVLAAMALGPATAPATDGRRDAASARLAAELLGASLRLDDRLMRDDDYASALAREVLARAQANLGAEGLDEALAAGADLEDAGLMARAQRAAEMPGGRAAGAGRASETA